MGRISQKLEMKKKNEHRKENAYDKHKKTDRILSRGIEEQTQKKEKRNDFK